MSKQKPLSKKDKEKAKKMRERLKNASKEIMGGSFKINPYASAMSSAARRTLREKLKIK
jgi:hypothetical protein